MPEPATPTNLVPLASQMTQSERVAYERECLKELETRVQLGNGWIQQFHQVREIRLVGEYPETAIFVRWRDARDDREREKATHLWISPVTGEPSSLFEYEGPRVVGREPPSEVAMLTSVWIMES